MRRDVLEKEREREMGPGKEKDKSSLQEELYLLGH